MSKVFDLIFNIFGSVVGFMQRIPLSDNVSLYDFSVAVLILSFVVVAFVPRVMVGSTSSVVSVARKAKEKIKSKQDNKNNADSDE